MPCLSSLQQGAFAMADNGLVTVKSSHRVKDTIDKLAAIAMVGLKLRADFR